MLLSSLLGLAGLFSYAYADCEGQIHKGFNYGATNSTGGCRDKAEFVRMFTAAKNLPNANGFTSARFYTSIDCATLPQAPNFKPMPAFEAAIETDTSLLLGLWVSGPNSTVSHDLFKSEIEQILAAVKQHGDKFADLVVGIGIGSEDLYRATPVARENAAKLGEYLQFASPEDIAAFINDARERLKGTALEGVPIGHIDTWSMWTAENTSQVIDAADFLGVNTFPYWQNMSISNAAKNFSYAMENVKTVSKNKPFWLTETGWPWANSTLQGAEPVEDESWASPENAQQYWREVGCTQLFDKVNTWYYILETANADQADDLSFNITTVNAGVSTPAFDLTCP